MKTILEDVAELERRIDLRHEALTELRRREDEEFIFGPGGLETIEKL